MKKRLWLKIVGVVAVVVCVLCIAAAAIVADFTAPPFEYGFWSEDDADIVQNFVIAGVDDDGTRTDLILFCQYGFSDDSLRVLQIPRDTKVVNNRNDKKINSAFGSYGKIQTFFDEIQGLIGLRPEKFLIVSFEGFRNLIDAVGGVEVDVPVRMHYTDSEQNLFIDLYPGKQILDGRKAEMFMRFRQNNDGTGYPDGDIGRIRNHKVFYEAVVNKLLDLENILNVYDIWNAVKDDVSTNFDVDDLLNYAEHLSSFNPQMIEIISLPGVGGYDENGVSYFFHDEAETRLLIENKFGG